MAKNNLINIHCFNTEIGKLGFDEDRNVSFFQYNPSFLSSGLYSNMFPLIIRRMTQTQVFDKYNSETFKGLPPMIADSLPDVFGNIVFKAWLESTHKGLEKITVLEQLAYVGKRGMGALEYLPSKEVTGDATINIDEITGIVEEVLRTKGEAKEAQLNHAALLNIFKIGTSAGGVRPKILISENKLTGQIIPGDLVYSGEYDHYIIKLGITEGLSYSKEAVEYAYYLMASAAGINMMPTKMIDNKHFATLRFDRQNGEKIHTLTASGMSGLDFKDPAASSYENLFDLSVYLKLPHKDTEQLFRRMVFNLVFANHDDHLKNHSFVYDKEHDGWGLSPAYDVTFSLNPEINFSKTSRALSLNGKRVGIALEDILIIADKYTIKNAKGIIKEVQDVIPLSNDKAQEVGIPDKIIASIRKDFMTF